MQRYLIQATHTVEQCGRGAQEWMELDLPRKEELFAAVQFGCEAGDHETWLLAEFADEDEAWSYVVPAEQAMTRVVPVSSYTFADMVSAHEG